MCEILTCEIERTAERRERSEKRKNEQTEHNGNNLISEREREKKSGSFGRHQIIG